MSGLYQLPGLFLTALCHVIVIYHIAEHRYSGKEKSCIEIHIRMQNNRLIIVCNNTCSDKLELSDRLPAGKSIGISSILSVCRKYDGNLDYKIEKDVCSACAVLNL